MCSWTFTVQNKPAAVAPKETITHLISSFLELGRRKLSMQPKFVAAQKMLLKRNPANIRKWIARFYYFRHLYSAGSCVYAHNNCMSCPSIWATLSALLINILLGSFQLFIVVSLSPKGWNNPIRSSASRGRLHYPHAERSGGFTHWLTDCWCATDDDSGSIITRAYFSALASLHSFVYFASSAATSRWRICMSGNCRRCQLQFSGILALGFVGNGVITVMINGPMTGRRWCR